MRRKKILMILDNNFDPDIRVAKEIDVLIEKGYHVTLLCWDRKCILPEREYLAELEVIRIRIKSGFQMGVKQLKYLFKFYIRAIWFVIKNKIRKELDFDLIYVHNYLMLWLGVFFKILFNKSLIFDAHELYFLEPIKMPEILRPIIRYSEIILLQFVTRFITVSRIRAKFYERYKKKIYIVANWYNPVEYNDSDVTQMRKKLGLPDDKFVIGYFGTLSYSRDVWILLEYGKKHKDDIILIGGGMGPYEDAAKRVSQSYPNVRFLGWVKDMKNYMVAIDVLYYVLKDTIPYYKYSSPNNLYIAIAYKKPLISNDLGEQGFLLREVDRSIIMRENTIEELERVVEKMKNIAYRREISEKMRMFQEEYNFEEVKKSFYSALKDL